MHAAVFPSHNLICFAHVIVYVCMLRVVHFQALALSSSPSLFIFALINLVLQDTGPLYGYCPLGRSVLIGSH